MTLEFILRSQSILFLHVMSIEIYRLRIYALVIVKYIILKLKDNLS